MRVSGLRVVVRVLDVRVRGDLWSRERNRLGPASLFRRIEVRVPGVQADEDPPWRERAPSAVAEERGGVRRDNRDEHGADGKGLPPAWGSGLEGRFPRRADRDRRALSREISHIQSPLSLATIFAASAFTVA